MKIAALAEVKNRLSFYIKAFGQTPIVITKQGKPVAASVNIANEDDLDSLLLAPSPGFQKLLAQANEGISRKGGIPLAEVKRRLATINAG